MKKVLIISTSLRKDSNSDYLAKAFQDGAIAAGHSAELVTLRGKTIQYCKGCLACQQIGHCVIKDDSTEIVEKMKDADVIVWATPVYYYSMSGQMKTLIDRANCLYSADYKFRDVYGLITATEEEDYTPQGTIQGIQGWVDCFEKATLKNCLFAGGVTDQGEILKFKDYLDKAYKMGQGV